MRSYEFLKKELLKAHEEFRPRKDTRMLTSTTLKKESKVLKEIFQALSPIIKFIDKKILIVDNIFTSYYPFKSGFVYDLDPYGIYEDKLTFKEKVLVFETPTENHITEYYMEDDEIIKGIMISMDIIEAETKFFDEDNPNNEFKLPKESSITAIDIYLLRSGKILKFDRFREDHHLFDFKHSLSLENPKELSFEVLPKYNSVKRILNSILLAYHRAISENENKFPILKKSLKGILKIKEKNLDIFD
ncbi:hypothetical protein LCGC14_1828300 [marine sediment metagenome]|uniref:Uncharacterized protein n=1 Tax=marine sediment metagenome TaxID=412755 RepID=A0A0F9IWE5_9ZZZZ